MIFKTTNPKLKHYNIPPTDENHELLRKAKAAIAASHPEQALDLLSTLKLKTLDIEITALSARLADLERTQRFGTESYDTETREHNKINKSIIFLITALEKEIARSFEFYDKIRAALKSRYETRLSQKLSNRQPVNLRLVPSTTGTTPQAANTFVQYSEGQIRGKLAEYYKDANGRLLLVGVPGAGKTTLLLQLELELLEQEITRIPVILNLARWSSEFTTLEAWIQEILPSEMGLTINKKMAGDLIAQNRLILLLDGLDEVKEEDRQVCLEGIGAYGEDSNRCFILSSRIDGYKAVAKDAPVNSQIEVGALTYDQLIEQLEKTAQNEGSKRLLAALKEDAILREIAEVPFYFNTLQLLFARGKYLNDLNFSALDTDDRKKEIEKSFVFEMFKKNDSKDYNTDSIPKYLGFFASRLQRENLVDFELIHLQYRWCRLSKWETKNSKFLEGLVLGLNVGLGIGLLGFFLFGILGILVLSLELNLSAALLRGLYIGSLGSLGTFLIGFMSGLFENAPYIITRDSISLNWRALINRENLALGLVIGLVIGLIFGLVFGLNGGLTFGLFTGLAASLGAGLGEDIPVIKTREWINWNWIELINKENLFGSLVMGLFTGVLFGLQFLGLIRGVVLGLVIFLASNIVRWFFDQLENHNSFIQIINPHERFSASAKTTWLSILQHWHLRHLLYKKGLLPKKLVPFLNDMVKCNILETTGASWRFRHRILQDYFADQWVETEFEPEQK